MKKLLSALLIALLLPTMMLMSACNDASKTSDDKLSFDYTTNFQYYYSNLNGINFPVTKSEKGPRGAAFARTDDAASVGRCRVRPADAGGQKCGSRPSRARRG